MAKLRGVGRLASTLLQSHLARGQADYENQLITGRQESQARLQHYLSMQDAAAKDPRLALRLSQAGAPGMEGYLPSSDDQMAPVTEDIAKATSPEQLGSLRGRFEQLRNQPGAVTLDQVQSLGDTFNAQRSQIDTNDASKMADTAQSARDVAFNTNQGNEDAKKLNWSSELGRDTEHKLMENDLDVQHQSALNPVLASRAGAETTARQMAEWGNPAVVKAKLDFETQKATAELARLGDKVSAQFIADKNAAISGLLPTYQRYRDLAVKVTSGPHSSGTAIPGQAATTISRIPYIGEVLLSGVETIGTAALQAGGASGDAHDIAELNRITDALAQGMANAVIGNKGPTSENDRRTAKNLLATMWQDSKTTSDLLNITDRMFTILPVVSARVTKANQFATPAEILEAAAAEAKGSQPPPTATGATDQPPSTDPLGRARTILQQRRGSAR